MEFFQNITRSDEVLNEKSEYFLNMDKIIEEAKGIKLERKTIQKLANKYKKDNPSKSNAYVDTYCYYTDRKVFKEMAK